MKAIAALILLGLLSGCSVNIVVAPDASVYIDTNTQEVQTK